MREFPKKFLSIRDKNGPHHQHRSKSAPPGGKARPSGSDVFRGMFKTDNPRRLAASGEAEAKRLESTAKDVQRRLDELGITGVNFDHIKDILATEYAAGDPEKAAQFIDIEQKALLGSIAPYDPQVTMVGAENRQNVTCYLDTLLFSMFAKMDAFECILNHDFPPDDSRNKLVNLLRIWVSMLRTGRLIHTDFTELIQETLAECGWPEAREPEQQDTSEAFGFITETLQLPLLSLQVDLFHHGKGDKDDHKVVYERLLNLAVPPDPEGKGIRLEDCLEDYFNTQVDVMRDSEEGKNQTPDDIRPHDGTSSLVNRRTSGLDDIAQASASPASVEAHTALPGAEDPPSGGMVTLQRFEPGLHRSMSLDAPPPSKSQVETTGATERRRSLRNRSASVIQRVLVDEPRRRSNADGSGTRPTTRRKGSSMIKAVTIPAWQFFRLIPWHAVSSNEPRNNIEVAMNFDQRPVVGICLKRYLVTEDGQPKRHNTYIDIPDSLRLPHFMLADGSSDGDEDGPVLDTQYKLVLQSVICHRGDSLQRGHYISFARVAPRLLTDNRRHDFDPPPDYEEAQWVKFDDLEVDGRVSYVDDVKKALKEEMPYLIFYQIVPMVDAPSDNNTTPEPPSYDDFKFQAEQPSTAPSESYSAEPSLKRGGEGKADGALEHLQSPPSKPPSIRFSSEAARRRQSPDAAVPYASTSAQGDSRRPSMNLTDSAVVSPARTPEWQQSPLMSPIDETTASRLSRAAARFRGRQSRPSSQSGENRVSSAMSRMAGIMMRPSRDGLGEPPSLNISKSGSLGRLSVDEPNPTAGHVEGESGGESDNLPRPSKGDVRKHPRSKGKSKDKDLRHRPDSQPERECTVM